MTDEIKTTQALLRALMREMEKTLAAPQPIAPPAPGTRRTRVNVREFNRGQQQEENWWDEGGDEDAFIGLRPRPKPRAKRRLR